MFQQLTRGARRASRGVFRNRTKLPNNIQSSSSRRTFVTTKPPSNVKSELSFIAEYGPYLINIAMFIGGPLAVYGIYTYATKPDSIAADEVDWPEQLPQVYLDIAVVGQDKPIGRIHLQLHSELCPRTTENFRTLITGELGFGYKNTKFHRVIPEFMAQGGDFEKNNGTGGFSIFGCINEVDSSSEGKTKEIDDKKLFPWTARSGIDCEKTPFEDENFIISHSAPYLLSMANKGPNTNGAQFFITTGKQGCTHLDGKHCVFGRVLHGKKVVRTIAKQGTSSGKPRVGFYVHDCGQFEPKDYIIRSS